MPYVSFFIYVRKKYKSRLQMFQKQGLPVRKRMRTIQTKEMMQAPIKARPIIQ